MKNTMTHAERELTLMEYLIIKKIKKDEEIVVDF